MFDSRTPRARAGRFVGAALAYLLVFAALPAPPLVSPQGARAAAAERGAAAAVPNIPPGSAYRQTNLVSDVPGLAPVLDPLLINPWGISMRGTSPFWVANAGSNTSTLYRGDVGGSPLVRNPSLTHIDIPVDLPTGTVGNPTDDFVVTTSAGSGPARFLFASISGFITGWNPAADPDTAVVASAPPGGPFSRIYTGLAIGNNGSGNFLYAADALGGKIDVFNASFALQPAASFPFTDPTVGPEALPPLYHPHNIQAIGDELYVAYTRVNPGPGDPNVRPGGAVNVFDFNGNFKRRIRLDAPGDPDTVLSAPWGLVLAPASFGVFGGALLVGNFDFDGRGHINAFDPDDGTFLGQLQDESGTPISIDGLWGIIFGNGGNGGDPDTLYFAAGISHEQHGIFGKLEPTTATATSLVRFATDNLAIDEGAGHIDITVIREGDVSGTATINYNTFDEPGDGRASQKSDYEIALGELTFAPGETSKTFRVLLVNDRTDEPNEVVSLALSNPSGAGVGLGLAHANLTINDNDATTSTVNPIDEATFFVRQHYLDFLNREPDPAGLNFWVNQITSCGSDAACVDIRRQNVSAAFFLSIEFQETGLLAYLTHRAAFGRRPLYGEFMRSTQALQRNFIFGTPGALDQLEANKQEFFADFVRGPEFVAAFPDTQTPAEFVDALFANAGVTPTAEERQAAIDEFGGAATSADLDDRARALRRVAENATFKQQEFNEAFVLMEYFGYLRRDPGEGGFQFWLAKLESFGGNFIAAEMVKAFIVSIEYRERFGPAD
ncbi:MAG TPA: TIGR03118 family protein [Pyrinomonadaceae bacterium]|nr:TIGR03118 family protein [Pyrinomonadaceae bacterium]